MKPDEVFRRLSSYYKSLPKLLLFRTAASPTFFLEVWLLALEFHIVIVLEELTPVACFLLTACFLSTTAFL